MSQFPPILVKLLQLTLSDNDHECLAAIRKANAYLASHRQQWIDVLTEHDDAGTRKDDEIEGLFAALTGAELTQKRREFLDGLQQFYEENGFLSKKQKSCLKQMAEQCT